MPTLGLIHNSPMLAGVFNEIAARIMPADVKLLHFVDESTIKNTIAAGHLEKTTMRQVIRLVGSAFDAGCDVAMVTCSSIGPGGTFSGAGRREREDDRRDGTGRGCKGRRREGVATWSESFRTPQPGP